MSFLITEFKSELVVFIVERSFVIRLCSEKCNCIGDVYKRQHQSIPSSYSCLVKNALVADVELDIVLSLPSIVLSVATSAVSYTHLIFGKVAGQTGRHGLILHRVNGNCSGQLRIDNLLYGVHVARPPSRLRHSGQSEVYRQIGRAHV